MAKTFDLRMQELVQETIGAQVIEILRLRAQLEFAQANVAQSSKPTDEHEPK